MPDLSLADLRRLLVQCWEAQAETVARWHEEAPAEPSQPGPDDLLALVLAQHLTNFRLWHVEDDARATDVGPEVIARCKRDIDRLNQQRNDLIEQVDTCLVSLVLPLLPAQPRDRTNTETLGGALDRLSILALKIYHMEEQTRREDVGPDHRASCRDKAEVLRRQREGLAAAVLDLVDEYGRGEKRPVVYRQFKMYNDPRLNPRLYGAGRAGGQASEE
ncbi:MAG: DUF4254 domain-containing protein [Thermodesulfobacteriota bacterium]